MVAAKIILLLTFGYIFYQDYRERMVFWFLFPIAGFISALLFYKSTLPELFWTSVAINAVFAAFLLLVVFFYSRIILKTKMVTTFGPGDIFLFISLAFSFSSVSFLTLFVFSLLFSLILHLFLKRHSKIKTVPLAGYMSLFFGLSHMAFWSGIIQSPYII